METLKTKPVDIKSRLRELTKTLLSDSRIGVAFRPVLRGGAEYLLSQIDDEQLRAGIIEVRDVMIPWLLDGDEDPNPQQ